MQQDGSSVRSAIRSSLPGFDNLATFYRVFRCLYGMTPSDLRGGRERS
ncbi:MAG TPA: hypothetical protein VND94_22965 [Terriglobia bacterium]|nr:hypothetical protein [Terriglobia bacterium]